MTGRAAFVSSSSFLRARTAPPTSPDSRFLLAMLFLDFMLTVRVEIENCIFLDSVQKRREADDNFEITKYVVIELILLSSIFLKKSAWFEHLKSPTKLYKDFHTWKIKNLIPINIYNFNQYRNWIEF